MENPILSTRYQLSGCSGTDNHDTLKGFATETTGRKNRTVNGERPADRARLLGRARANTGKHDDSCQPQGERR